MPLRGPVWSTLYTWNGKGAPSPIGGVPVCLRVPLCPGWWRVLGVLMCPPECLYILQVFGGFPAAFTSSQGSQLSRQMRRQGERGEYGVICTEERSPTVLIDPFLGRGTQSP